jgi:hypothetical protein
MTYDLFDASKGTKARFHNFMTWPQRADEKPYQVGLGVRDDHVGTVASVCAELQGGGSTASVQEQKRLLKEWIDASGVDFAHTSNGQ